VPVTAGEIAVSPSQLGARIAAGFNQDALERKDDMPKQHLADVLELADLYRPSWSEMQRQLRESGVPLNDEPTTDPPSTTDPPKTETDPPPSTDPPKTETDPPKTETDPDPETVTMPKGEAERLKREVAAAAKSKRDRERKEAEDAGEHQKVVQGVEQERDDKDRELTELQAEFDTYKHQGTVRTVADRLKFHDSEDAVLRVPKEVAAKGEAAIEKYLRELAQKSPHLVGEGAPRSGPSLPGNGGGGDVEQLSSTEGMSPEAISKALSEGRLRDYLKS
jgi:hypothetical protein